VIVCDTSPGAGCTESRVATVTAAVLPSVVRQQGALRWYRLDDVQSVVQVGKYVVGAPVRESRAAIANHEREAIADGQRVWQQVQAGIFAVTPRSSPLAIGLSLVVADAKTTSNDVHVWVLSDGRETGLADFECNPPSRESWLAALRQTGALLPGSLDGVTISFLGINPAAPVPGNRCKTTLRRGLLVQELWKAALEQAGARVEFSREDDIPNTAIIYFLTPALLGWRKARVKLRAMRDRARGVYRRLPIIIELIGPRPEIDPSDPKHQRYSLRLRVLEVSVEDIRARLYVLLDTLTQYVRWWIPFLGMVFAYLTELIAWAVLLRDAGMPSPERWFIGSMGALFVIFMVVVAVRQEREEGARPWWYKLLLAALAILVLALAVVRVSNAMTGDTNWWEELALGLILVFGSIGPALASEYLASILRPIWPLVAQARELKRRLHREEQELDEITDLLSKQAQLRRAWECEASMLGAVYDGINPDANGGTPFLIHQEGR